MARPPFHPPPSGYGGGGGYAQAPPPGRPPAHAQHKASQDWGPAPMQPQHQYQYQQPGYHQNQAPPQQPPQGYQHPGYNGPQQAWAEEKGGPSEAADANDPDRQVEDIFSFARHNRVDKVEELLDKGVPVNVRDQFGNTILAVSCQNGHKRVAKAALRRGADINAQNYKGNTPLHFCFTYGYGDTLGQYMISKGADASMRNHAGVTSYEGLGR